MDIIGDTKTHMHKILDVLKNDLATIRTGRAAPSLVENVVINAYGGTAKLRVMELGTVGATDSQTLVITPFDNSVIHEIEKGIQEANMGLSPVVDGQIIRISIPPLSEERRQELIKLMHQKLENGRIMIRQSRHDSMNEIKKQVDNYSEDEIDRFEKEVQKTTDDMMAEIDALGKKKEEELMQI